MNIIQIYALFMCVKDNDRPILGRIGRGLTGREVGEVKSVKRGGP